MKSRSQHEAHDPFSYPACSNPAPRFQVYLGASQRTCLSADLGPLAAQKAKHPIASPALGWPYNTSASKKKVGIVPEL